MSINLLAQGLHRHEKVSFDTKGGNIMNHKNGNGGNGVTMDKISNLLHKFSITISKNMDEFKKEMKQEMSDFRKEITARMDKLEQRMDSLEQRMDKLEQRMDSLEQRMDKLEGIQLILEQKLDKTMSVLHDGYVQNSKNIKDHEKRISNLERIR